MNKSAFVVAVLTGWLLVGAVVAAPQFVPLSDVDDACVLGYHCLR
jgi:hypothetical protein